MIEAHAEIATNHLAVAERTRRRQLILRDTRVLSLLTVVIILLGILTHYYFQSFAQHRRDAAQRWYERGLQAMKTDKSDLAVEDFRAALSSDVDERRYQLALAEALAAAGRVDEARAYFLALREAQPGNGQINLELARLAVRKQDDRAARDEYQQAIYGDWPGDGRVRRRETRLELVKYLLSRQAFANARAELLISAGNAADDPALELTIAGLMEQAQDPANALVEYEHVLRLQHDNPTAVLGIARTAAASAQPDIAREYANKFLELAGRRRGISQFDVAAAHAIVAELDAAAEQTKQEQEAADAQAREAVVAELRAERVARKRR